MARRRRNIPFVRPKTNRSKGVIKVGGRIIRRRKTGNR